MPKGGRVSTVVNGTGAETTALRLIAVIAGRETTAWNLPFEFVRKKWLQRA